MKLKFFIVTLSLGILSGLLVGCAEVSVPDARNVKIPNPVSAEQRREAVNERPDSVMYLPLGEDVLLPERMVGQDLPTEIIGPFELRAETLAGALQLILADYDISIAFETDAGLTKKVTVANLKGPLNKVVERVCSLADLYCLYEDGALVVKDTQTFTVSLPPLGDAEGGQEFIADIISGLTAVIGSSGSAPVSDPTTRTIIYSASQRTSKLAENYFQRLRANTAMIVFETYIWEVSLDSGNSTGIDWAKMKTFGKFATSVALNGSVSADFTNPVSIGLPTTQAIGATPTQLIEFLSQFGAVKTISQPQITVLSGASAALRVADTQNYVSEVTSTSNANNTSTSVSTDSVDSGFTLTVGSSWDNSTVYANVNVNLTNVDQIEDFTFSDGGAGGTDTIIQLPQTTERELTTQIRVRPGDSVLIAGLVRERDNFNSRGPGFMEPIVPDSRTAQTSNLELVILLRPRVIVYTASDDPNYKRFLSNKADDLLKSNLARRGQIEAPAIVAPAYVPPVVSQEIQPAPLPVIESEAPAALPVVAPVIKAEPVVSAAPVYKKSISVTQAQPEVYVTPAPPPPPVPIVAPQYEPAQVYAPPNVYENNGAGYSQGYSPSRASGYVSGRASTQDYSAPVPARVVGGSYVAPSAVASPVYPSSSAPSTAYPASNSPLSADVYNGAKSLNVYEIYEQGQKSQ